MEVENIVESINNLAEVRLIDLATFFIGLGVLFISFESHCNSKRALEVQTRNEKQGIHTKVLNILYDLKKYDGVDDDYSKDILERIERVQSIAGVAFSLEAQHFLIELKDRMGDMHRHKINYEKNIDTRNNLDSDTIDKLISMGLFTAEDLNKTETDEYRKDRSFFKYTTFKEFKKLFEIN
ncbi:hypothetical protein [Moritella sp. F3]|uniref:hypothetical protein n=1 Tax=Moritella sp. F3 TaxID=2718882 RepID=UPI0018E12777|nr:hypothetical protein [Moritella sp. F3]GIC79339.1 hypothetical protein FMO001_40660 [Moritella sp. F1]GIC84058.1 hypothetical protein FMO003_43380 [Moritella sp. F3]